MKKKKKSIIDEFDLDGWKLVPLFVGIVIGVFIAMQILRLMHVGL